MAERDEEGIGLDPTPELRETAEQLAQEYDEEEVREALAAVEAWFDRVIGEPYEIEIDGPEDLERLRKELPTDPREARLLRAMMPEGLRNVLEYVRASSRQSAYWRFAPPRNDLEALSKAELRARIAFAEAASDTQGTTGTVEVADGREVSRNSLEVGDQLRGKEYADDELTDTERSRAERALARLVDEASE